MSVSVSGGKITAIKTVQEDETDFAKEAIAQIAEAVLSGKSVDSVDAVSGATITSNATKQAIKEALNASRGIASKKAKKALKDENVDIVVIGAGGAGLSAATEAASKGKKVIVLEKMGNAGGNTSSATGGLNASETSVQKKLGIEDSNAQYIEDTIKGGHNLNDPDLVRNMVEHSAETVDWLIGLGADLTDVGKMAGSTNKRTHRPQGGAPVGAHLVPVLEKAAQTAGAEIRYNNKVTQILKDK
ncbi:MAG: FAD-dependent oxidoreductase, partial [Treponema sp.]|nr:FAD-dependent oxidoreductase [Treponema sp.]